MTEYNEYTKQGIALRQYVFETIGAQLFAERRRRGHTLAMLARQTNITEKFADKAECGIGKSRWTILALLLKHYKKTAHYHLKRYKKGITKRSYHKIPVVNTTGIFNLQNHK